MEDLPLKTAWKKDIGVTIHLRCPNLCNVYCNTVEHMQTQIISCQWTFFISLISARKLKMNKNHHVTFLCPRDDSQGALRFAPVCPFVCLSVHPFVTLYGVEFLAHLSHRLRVSYCHWSMSVVRRPSCVVRRPLSVVNNCFKQHLLCNR